MTTSTSSLKVEGPKPRPSTLINCARKCARAQIEYDAKGLKCLGELSKKETEDFIRDMVTTANDFIDENIADETTGSHGDLPA